MPLWAFSKLLYSIILRFEAPVANSPYNIVPGCLLDLPSAGNLVPIANLGWKGEERCIEYGCYCSQWLPQGKIGVHLQRTLDRWTIDGKRKFYWYNCASGESSSPLRPVSAMLDLATMFCRALIPLIVHCRPVTNIARTLSLLVPSFYRPTMSMDCLAINNKISTDSSQNCKVHQLNDNVTKGGSVNI